MRFLLGLFLTAVLAGMCLNLYAKVTSSAIEGKILTEERAPAEGATIILLKYRDSSIVSSTVSNKDGLFKFDHIQPESYLLLITTVGYNKTFQGPFVILAGRVFKTPELILHVTSKQLNQISVFGKRPEIETKPGR